MFFIDKFDEVNILANAFLFFLAGYETSALTTSFCLYELALNQDIQDKLRTEVEAAYKEHNQSSLSDVIKDLKYLDAVISGKNLKLFFWCGISVLFIK